MELNLYKFYPLENNNNNNNNKFDIKKIKNNFPRQNDFKPHLKNLNFITRDCQNDENMA